MRYESFVEKWLIDDWSYEVNWKKYNCYYSENIIMPHMIQTLTPTHRSHSNRCEFLARVTVLLSEIAIVLRSGFWNRRLFEFLLWSRKKYMYNLVFKTLTLLKFKEYQKMNRFHIQWGLKFLLNLNIVKMLVGVFLGCWHLLSVPREMFFHKC